MKNHISPYDKWQEHSCYFKLDQGNLTHCFNQQAAGLRETHLHHIFKSTIESPSFSCVGAKAAMKLNSYRFGFYNDMQSDDTFKGLCHDLAYFAKEQHSIKGNFTTFAACFDHTVFHDAHDFDEKVWALLGKLCSEDSAHHKWDKLATDDPENPHFAFSFAETAYFVAALSPVSDRLSRQFVKPMLVFNAHFQFETMKQDGKFEKLRDKIRERDQMLEGGKANLIAADFGDGKSEAEQYCGVVHEDKSEWKCPFHKHYKPS